MLTKSMGGCVIRLAILLIFFALSLGGATAAPAGVGTDIVKIISVNYQGADQWVEIANRGSGLMDLGGWSLKNRGNQSYAFPANFTLKAGSIARVHSKDGSNSSSDLYNSALFWSEMGDTASLEDIAGRIISQYRYPIEVSTPSNASDNKPLSLPNAFSSGGMNPPFLPAYRPPPGKEMSSLRSGTPVNLTGHTFICHGGPLNWAWTTGLG